MKHEFLDHHSHGDSVFHRMHPAPKMGLVFIFILCVVTLIPGQEGFLFSYTVLLGGLLLLTRVPILHTLGKGLKLIPFIFILTLFLPFLHEGTTLAALSTPLGTITVTHEGLALFINIFWKSTLAIFAVVFLNLTTPFHDLLKGLQNIGAPRIMTDTLAVAYRYLFVVADERDRMLRARKARRIQPNFLLEWKSLSHLIGTLFIRTYERGERLYAAMCARGFQGTIVTLDQRPVQRHDIVLATGLVVFILLIRFGLTQWLMNKM